MTDEGAAFSLRAFESALERLGDALAQPKTEWTRDAAIQRFEFTFELAWKAIARFAQREGVECNSPRRAFRAALKLGWIDDDALWLDMLDDRNLASHTYNEVTADALHTRLPLYLTGLAKLREQLRRLAEVK